MKTLKKKKAHQLAKFIIGCGSMSCPQLFRGPKKRIEGKAVSVLHYAWHKP